MRAWSVYNMLGIPNHVCNRVTSMGGVYRINLIVIWKFRSVDRAVAILFHVADCEYPLGLSEISRLTGFDKATCLRLMNTLEMHGLICQEAHSRHYKLGPGISRLTYGFSTDLRYLAPPLTAATVARSQREHMFKLQARSSQNGGRCLAGGSTEQEDASFISVNSQSDSQSTGKLDRL